MANPLQILLGGPSAGHEQREAQIASAAAQQNQPPPAPTQVQPSQAPTPQNTVGQPSFMSSAATLPPPQQQLGKTLLGQ